MDVKSKDSNHGRHDEVNKSYSESSAFTTELDELQSDADDSLEQHPSVDPGAGLNCSDEVSSHTNNKQCDPKGSDISEARVDNSEHDLPNPTCSVVDIKSEPSDDCGLEPGDAQPSTSESDEWEGPGNDLVPVPLNLIPAEGNQGLLRIDVDDPIHPVPSGLVNVKEESHEDKEASSYDVSKVAASVDQDMEPNPAEESSVSSVDHSGEKKSVGPIKELARASKKQKLAAKGRVKVKKSHICDKCEKIFSYPSELARHTLIHSGVRRYTCEQCDKMFKLPGDLKAHERLHTGERPYACDQCHKTYKKRFTLTEHKRIHAGVRPYKCDQCDKAFTRSHDVSLHKLTNHSTEKPFRCDQCDKAFKRSGDLKKHKYVHSGERPFPCDECGKSFKQSSALALHKRSHTEERPYTCNQCEMAFKQSSALDHHKLVHSEAPFVCTFMCSQCDEVVFTESDLYQHKLIHAREKPFACGQCDETFKLSSDLALHILIHTKNKYFTCDECDQTFTKSSSLKQHKCVHNDERPFLCDQCGKIFLHRSFLIQHKDIIHSGSDISPQDKT